MASPGISMVVDFIRPEFLSPAQIRGYLLATCQRYVRRILKDWREVTSAFEEHRDIQFKHEIRYAGGNIIAKVWSEDEILRYLDQGTDIRWAVMSNPFLAKTDPGWIGSRAGEGYAVVRGRRAMQQRNIAARPGIKARRWTQAISVKHQEGFVRDIRIITDYLYTGTSTTRIVP